MKITVEVVYFILVAIALYAASDWILQRIELWRSERLESRSLVFFVLLLSLALPTFALIRYLAGQ